MADEQGAVHEEQGAEGSPSEAPASPAASGASVLATREGQFVGSIARIVALAQCLGLFLLVAFLVRYHTQVSSGLELNALGNTYQEITAETEEVVSPAVMLVPVLAAVLATISWGVWRMRLWARRLAIIFALVLVAGGVFSAYTAENMQPEMFDDRDMEMIGAEDMEDVQGVLQLAAILSGFYGVVLGLLLLPSVGRVFAAASHEDAHAEKRFSIKKEAPRDHFQVEHRVDQL